MDTEEVNQGMSKEIRQDALIPLTADLVPEIGTLLAKLRREVDKEWDLYRPWYQCVAHQFGMVFVEEGIAVVGDIDDEGILLTIALDDLALPFRETIRGSGGSRYKESRQAGEAPLQ